MPRNNRCISASLRLLYFEYNDVRDAETPSLIAIPECYERFCGKTFPTYLARVDATFCATQLP